MKKKEYSPGLILAWQIAALEADYTKKKHIGIDQVFIGICSLEKILNDNKMKKNLSTSLINYVENENNEIIDIFWNLKIDIRHLRREIRVSAGTGDHKTKNKIIHRDKECKIYFENAEITAKKLGSSNVRCIHLLISILENPSFNIKKTTKKLEIDINKFLAEVLNKASKKFVQSEVFSRYNEFEKIEGYNKAILDTYGIDLTENAREGKIEPIVGRENELLNVIGILTKKKKSNPLIIGEAGVGKTALVRGLALKIVAGEVPPQLKDKKIIEINMGSIVAGTKYRGDFEEKITKLIDEIQENPDIIIFIDEIHSIIGAGRAEGNLDASNILKPALSHEKIKCIGATTISEYRKYFEKDSALDRRFQPIMILEPTINETILILKGLKKDYETHHNLKIDDQALESAVELSVRYLHDRNLPDKALDVLDEACSKKSIQILNKSSKNNIIKVEDIVKVLENMTGIPIKIKDDEIENVLNLNEILKKKVIGQNEAIEKVSRRLRIARSGLQDPNRPTGVFLFLGPTGVGKTELAKTLSSTLLGNEKAIIKLDMSEYMDKQSISKLIGATPGYVGYGEEGYLTGALKTNPYSIVLLDEIEKANFQIFDLFLQIFDEGILTDGKGTIIDAKNSIFIMTSNIAVPNNNDYGRAYGAPESVEFKKKDVMKCLMQNFRPEFLNRIDEIIVFNRLEQKDLEQIAKIKLFELTGRLSKAGIKLSIDNNVLIFISKIAYEENFGARPITRVIGELIEDPLSKKIISKEMKDGDSVLIKVKNHKVQFINE